jgi:hypothetical protein
MEIAKNKGGVMTVTIEVFKIIMPVCIRINA